MDCFLCKKRLGIRDCLLLEYKICVSCCKKKHSYDKCEGCSFRVWTPGCSKVKINVVHHINETQRIIAKMPVTITPIPFYKKKGHVYVMRSHTEPDLVKIGYTYRNAEKRLNDIDQPSGRFRHDPYYKGLHLFVELETSTGGKLLEEIAQGILLKLKRQVRGETFCCTKEEIQVLFINYC